MARVHMTRNTTSWGNISHDTKAWAHVSGKKLMGLTVPQTEQSLVHEYSTKSSDTGMARMLPAGAGSRLMPIIMASNLAPDVSKKLSRAARWAVEVPDCGPQQSPRAHVDVMHA